MKIDFYRLFTPSAWYQKGVTDYEWDKELNSLLDKVANNELNIEYEKSRYYDKPFIIIIGDVGIWVRNWPYCYGQKYCTRDESSWWVKLPNYSDDNILLPTLKTRVRLKKIMYDKFRFSI